jgi:hypothetical protein
MVHYETGFTALASNVLMEIDVCNLYIKVHALKIKAHLATVQFGLLIYVIL